MKRALKQKLLCVGCAIALAAGLIPMAAWGNGTNSEGGGEIDFIEEAAEKTVENNETEETPKQPEDEPKEDEGNPINTNQQPGGETGDSPNNTRVSDSKTPEDSNATPEESTLPVTHSDAPDDGTVIEENGDDETEGQPTATAAENTIEQLDSISVSETKIRIPIISKCLICGGTHGERSPEECDECGGSHPKIDFTVTVSNTNGNIRTTFIVGGASEENGSAYGFSPLAHSASNTEHTCGISVVAQKPETTQLEVYGMDDEGNRTTEIKYVTVEIYEAELPKFEANDSVALWSIDIGEEDTGNETVSTFPNSNALGSYKMCEYISLLGGYIGDGCGSSGPESHFIMGNPYVEEPNCMVYSVKMDDESIARTAWNHGWYCLQPVSIGKTIAHFQDIFGNKADIPIEVVDVIADARKNYSLSEKEITISVGEIVNLKQYIQGKGICRYFVCNPSNWSIAMPLFISADTFDDASITGLVGKRPRTITVSFNILVGDDEGGGVRNIPLMDLAEFATMTIHVKAPDKAYAAGSPDSTFKCDLVDASEAAKKLVANNGLKLTVKRIADNVLTSQQKESMQQILGKNGRIGHVFDISLIDPKGSKFNDYSEDDVLNFVSRIALTGPLANLNPGTLAVHYLGTDGDTWEIDSWVYDGYLYLATEHFSPYLVSGEPVDESTSNTTNKGTEENLPQNSNDTSKKPETTATTSPAKNTVAVETALAQTGDEATNALTLAFAAMFGALATAAIAHRRIASLR